ncbi:hypothetical protein [Chitinophaga sp.]|uniref:hypothetical protein n=1 Tax=Chitinophaga sp. TaxID=1869181 RepID=UPI0031E13A79
MANNVPVDVNVNLNGAQTLKDLKKELKEAQGQAIALARQFGELSPQAQAAVARVAALRDEIADMNERVALADPGAKFQVLGNAIQTVAGGFSAAQGAMALFGAESQDLQKTMVKLQGALALSQGLSTIADSWKDFQRLGAVIRTQVVGAFTTLKGAIVATGVGALVIALGLIIANFESIENWLKKVIPGFEGFGKVFDKVKAVAMGALSAIVEEFKIIGDILGDIFKGDFSGAIKEAKNSGKRLANAYVQGFNEEVADQAAEASRKAAEDLVKQQENQLKILRAYGATRKKEADALEMDIAKNKIKSLKNETKDEKDAVLSAQADLEALRIKQAQEEGQNRLNELKQRQALQTKALQDAGVNTIGLQEKQLQAQLALEKRYGLDTKDTIQAIADARLSDKKAQFDKELADLKAQQEDEVNFRKISGDAILNNQIAALRKQLEAAKISGQDTADIEKRIADLQDKTLFNLKKVHLDAQLELYRKYGISLKGIQDQQAAEELDRRQKLNELLNKKVYAYSMDNLTALQGVGKAVEKLNKDNEKVAGETRAKTEEQEKAKQGLYSSTAASLQTLADASEYSSDIQTATAAASAALIAFYEEGKQGWLEKTSAALKAATAVFGTQTAQGKAVAIASTTIDTYQSASLAYRNGQMVGGPWGIALGIAAAAAAVVAGIARVKQITAVKIPGATSSSSASTIASASTPSVPTINPNMTSTLVDQAMQQNSNLQQAQRVYVVETDITDAQKRVADIKANAQF